MAINEWQQNGRRGATLTWIGAAREHPQWTNAEWRSAIYPPHICATIEQLDAARQRVATLRKHR